MLYLLLQALIVLIVGSWMVATIAIQILLLRLISHDLEELIKRRAITRNEAMERLRLMQVDTGEHQII